MPSEEAGMPSLKEVFRRYFQRDGLPVIDVLLNTLKFSLTSSGSLTVPFYGNKACPFWRLTPL